MKKMPPRKMSAELKVAHYVIDTVCAHFNIDKIYIMRKSKIEPMCTYRHIAMSLIRRYTSLPLLDIAQLFSQRNHTTTIHAISNVAILVDVYDEWREHYYQIDDLLRQVIRTKVAA